MPDYLFSRQLRQRAKRTVENEVRTRKIPKTSLVQISDLSSPLFLESIAALLETTFVLLIITTSALFRPIAGPCTGSTAKTEELLLPPSPNVRFGDYLCLNTAL